ncbi:MAG: hypothetical protein ACLP5H_11425 [Desulfomonilaceae bacterium]
MADLPAGKDSVRSMSLPCRASRSAWTARWTVAQAVVLGLMFLCQGFINWDDPPRGQPAQIISQVNYDPNLSDPFFETERWTNGNWVTTLDADAVNRRIVVTDTLEQCPSGEEKLHCLKITARCVNSLDFKHPIHFCDASLLDGGGIELHIHDPTLLKVDPFDQHLLIGIKEGVFWSQYRVAYEEARGPMTWTTKKQELILDKQVYHRGDVIKGRIVFECKENYKAFVNGVVYTTIIKVNGVFKTVLK